MTGNFSFVFNAKEIVGNKVLNWQRDYNVICTKNHSQNAFRFVTWGTQALFWVLEKLHTWNQNSWIICLFSLSRKCVCIRFGQIPASHEKLIIAIMSSGLNWIPDGFINTTGVKATFYCPSITIVLTVSYFTKPLEHHQVSSSLNNAWICITLIRMNAKRLAKTLLHMQRSCRRVIVQFTVA